MAYSEADRVFLGRILNTREDTSDGPMKKYVVRFAVEQVYKGPLRAEEVVTFEQDFCAERTLQPGETYLVYTEGANLVPFCNNTHRVSEKSPALSYLTGLSSDNPVYTIRGFVNGLSEQERGHFRVVIRNDKSKITRRLDKAGWFSATVRDWGVYHVSLNFPFEASVVEMTSGMIGYNVQVTSAKNRTVASYEVKSVPNHCDDRLVQFARAR